MKKERLLKVFGLAGIRYKVRQNISMFLFSFHKKSNQEKIDGIKGIHVGKRCFIICNGPSLRADDLTKIHENGDITIASNKIDKIFSQTPWRPTYYTVLDQGLQYSLLPTMQKVPAKLKFFRDESYVVTSKAKGNIVWLSTNGDRALLDNPKFSEDANIIYTIATVTYAMLQLAVYMGMREIYIIGCDNSYGREVKKDGTVVDNGTVSYFAGSDPKEAKLAAATWEMNVAYEYARKYADEHNIRIYNATRGGHLEAFERVDFDSLFK